MNENIFLFEYASSGAFEPIEPSITIEGLGMFITLKEGFEKEHYPLNCFIDPEIGDFPGIPITNSLAHDFDNHLSSSDLAMIIAPESDGILSRLTEKVEKSTCGNLGSDLKAVEITSDKYLTYKKFKGINTPKTFLYNNIDNVPLDFPFIAKPRDGVSGEGVHLINSVEEIKNIPHDHIIQEYVPGKPGSASCLVGDETHIISFNTQELENFEYLGAKIPFSGIDPEPFYKTIDKIPGLFGHVGIDFIMDESGEIQIIEINPRPTTPIIGFEKAYGINLAQLIVDNFHGKCIPEIKIRNQIRIKKRSYIQKKSLIDFNNYSISLEVPDENSHF